VAELCTAHTMAEHCFTQLEQLHAVAARYRLRPVATASSAVGRWPLAMTSSPSATRPPWWPPPLTNGFADREHAFRTQDPV